MQDAAFRQGLREFGYVEGENLIIEARHANNDRDRIAELAADLVRLPAEVILVSSAQDARAVLAITTTIPIVSAGAGDHGARRPVTRWCSRPELSNSSEQRVAPAHARGDRLAEGEAASG